MKDSTLELISTVLTSDETVTKDHADSILRLCRQPVVRRKLIGAREAMEILKISRPTLRAYVKGGSLTQINFSTRKVRFDEAEVRHLACSGV